MPWKPADPGTSVLSGSPEIHEHLEELLGSELFRRTSSLNHLLRYLVGKVLEGDGEPLKEAVIAMDVFHRSGAFDSRLDNIVRVHAYRLRKLLDAYYEKEAKPGKVRFVIPKGTYNLQVEHPPQAEFELPALDQPQSAPPPQHPPRPYLALAAALACGFLGGAALVYAFLRPAPPKPAGILAPPLSTLWGSVFHPGAECVVSFTNPAFLWTDNGGPRIYFTYQGPLSAASGTPVTVKPKDPFLNTRAMQFGDTLRFSHSWTGTGELLAIHKLTALAANAGFPLKAIRSRALNYSDIRNVNVIFLGSPWANDMQSKFNIGLTPFVCISNRKIQNNEPKPGEAASFESETDPATRQVTATYALFSVLPGVGADTRFVSASGINTDGTMAAMDLMTSARGVSELIRRFGRAENQPLPEFFQVVIRTQIIKGDPAGASIVAVRAIQLAK